MEVQASVGAPLYTQLMCFSHIPPLILYSIAYCKIIS